MSAARAADATVRVTTRGAARILTVDRATKKNALDRATIERIASCIEDASADRAVRGVVLAAIGDVFLAGGDLAELALLPPTREGADAVLAMGARLDAIDASAIPIIAAIAGDVYGGDARSSSRATTRSSSRTCASPFATP